MTPAQLDHYLVCLARGCSPRLAEMLAYQQGPALMTDSVFLEGDCNGNQFDGQEATGDFYLQEAKRAGVNVKGKKYLSGLAAYPGDPRAWVSGRGDAQKVCEERGWACQGAVKVKMGEVPEPTGGGMATSLVEEKMQDVLSHVPSPECVDQEALRDDVIQRYAPPWARKEVPDAT